jgi:hypothetical protein
MLNQLTLEDIEKEHFKGFAEKVMIPEIRYSCSECHVLVSEKDVSCRHCGALFVEGA